MSELVADDLANQLRGRERATAGPTHKAQCENGGYTQLGFKNQGQCVAFVQRGPKP